MGVLRELVTDTMRGVGLLTRLPVASRWFEGFDGRYDRAAGAFPLVGLVLAIPVCAVSWLAGAAGLPPVLTGLLSVAMLIVATGALHDDGLADTADGLGGRDRERRLAIMRDSSIGTYGVLTLLVGLGIRASAVGVLFVAPLAGAAAVVAALAMSRAAMVWLWWSTPPARSDGAAAASGRPTRGAVRTAIILASILSGPALLMLGPWRVALAVVLVALVVRGLVRYAVRALGGHTGDVLGACVVASEGAVLLALAVGSTAADMIGP